MIGGSIGPPVVVGTCIRVRRKTFSHVQGFVMGWGGLGLSAHPSFRRLGPYTVHVRLILPLHSCKPADIEKAGPGLSFGGGPQNIRHKVAAQEPRLGASFRSLFKASCPFQQRNRSMRRQVRQCIKQDEAAQQQKSIHDRGCV